MVETQVQQLQHIQQDIEWFTTVVNARMNSYFDSGQPFFDVEHIGPPDFDGEASWYSDFVEHYRMTHAERLVLILSLIPHIQPQVLDVFFTKNEQYDRGYTEFGGIKGQYFSGFIPTAETALFILAANDLSRRGIYSKLFDEEHFFSQHNIIELENPHPGEPYLSGVLRLSQEHIDHFTIGRERKPRFSSEFPAKVIDTNMEWEQLVLDAHTLDQVNEIRAWLQYKDVLMNEWGLAKKVKPGYKCLFYGPPGTGKTLTATLIGKAVDMNVYRVDLSMVVSKYIGETEKNLSKVFDKAAHRKWILFFDEADSLFGKRTNVSDSHDRYANQEVSFLLQKIEEHDGLVILASNLKTNIDEAFTRRFQSIIYFPMPNAGERLRLWQNAMPEQCELAPDLRLDEVAEQYEIAGGSIINIVRYLSLQALKNQDNQIKKAMLLAAIRKEFQKEGKTM